MNLTVALITNGEIEQAGPVRIDDGNFDMLIDGIMECSPVQDSGTPVSRDDVLAEVKAIMSANRLRSKEWRDASGLNRVVVGNLNRSKEFQQNA